MSGEEGQNRTRTRLLLAARKCLLNRGHATTTVKAIAAEAGVNHGLVHHYFGSKENLFADLLRLERSEFDRKLSIINNEENLISFLMDTLFQNARLYSEYIAMAQEMPLLKKLLLEILADRRRDIAERFHIKNEVDAVLILATVGGLAFQYTVDKSLPVRDVLLKLFSSFK